MAHAALKTATQEILVEKVIPHAPERIWGTLTTGELIGRWLMMKPSGFEPVKGARFAVKTARAGLWDGMFHCEVLEVARNKSLVYSWRGGHESNTREYGSLLDTIVAWTLVKVGGGTRVRLVHSGFVRPRNNPAFWNMSSGWNKIVGRISALSDEHLKTTDSGETRK
jgi:uncharacterized protein YndB with AHSA1/START domain